MKLGDLVYRSIADNNKWQDDSLARQMVTILRLIGVISRDQFDEIKYLLGFQSRLYVDEEENGICNYIIGGDPGRFDHFNPVEFTNTLIRILCSEGKLKYCIKEHNLEGVRDYLNNYSYSMILKEKAIFLEKIASNAFVIDENLYFLFITEYDVYALKRIKLNDITGDFTINGSGEVISEALSNKFYIQPKRKRIIVEYAFCNSYFEYDITSNRGWTVNGKDVLGTGAEQELIYIENRSLWCEPDNPESERLMLISNVDEQSMRMEVCFDHITVLPSTFPCDFFVPYRIDIISGNRYDDLDAINIPFWEEILEHADPRYYIHNGNASDVIFEHNVINCPENLTISAILKKIKSLFEDYLLSIEYVDRITRFFDILRDDLGYDSNENIARAIFIIMYYFSQISIEYLTLGGGFSEECIEALSLAASDYPKEKRRDIFENKPQDFFAPYIWHENGRELYRKEWESISVDYDGFFIGFFDLLPSGTVKFEPRTMVLLKEGVVKDKNIVSPYIGEFNSSIYYDLANSCFRVHFPLDIQILPGERERIRQTFGFTNSYDKLYDENSLPDW